MYDQIKEKGDIQLDILRKMSMSDLLEESRREHVGEVCGMNRRDLIFKILKEKVRSGGVMFGSGTLEILPDGFGFLRSSDCHYLSCPDDIYVSPSQIRRFGLQTGSIVAGQIRPPKETERYFALLRVEKINGLDPSSANHRIMFDDLTPLHPDKRIAMDAFPEEISTRVVDLIAPVGFGQRGLIVSPPRAGKTILMQKMAQSAIKNYPDLYVMMLLIDERPEEVTDAERQIKGPQCEVISSTFDEAPSRHIQVAEMVLEKAKRLVECGRDVLIFLDSITRLARAYNAECPMSGKLLSGGVDANALQKPKRFFGSARKVEEGGSLTIIATALVETGSRMDEVIFEEFKGTGNMEIVLDRRLVEQRVWPAIDVNRSGTRREEALMDPDEYQRICVLHRALGVLDPTEAMTQLTARLAKTKSNAEFLMSIRADQD
ncbi:MAG: transcription termination factor Rho [Thermoguttaceae bacterium]|nr:transcription termination factor Rho [Thermoguttaceae bacterium]